MKDFILLTTIDKSKPGICLGENWTGGNPIHDEVWVAISMDVEGYISLHVHAVSC